MNFRYYPIPMSESSTLIVIGFCRQEVGAILQDAFELPASSAEPAGRSLSSIKLFACCSAPSLHHSGMWFALQQNFRMNCSWTSGQAQSCNKEVSHMLYSIYSSHCVRGLLFASWCKVGFTHRSCSLCFAAGFPIRFIQDSSMRCCLDVHSLVSCSTSLYKVLGSRCFRFTAKFHPSETQSLFSY